MCLCSSDDKDPIRPQSFRYAKYSSRDIGLRFRISGYDLRSMVVVAFKEITVELAVELRLVALALAPHIGPELFPASPLPPLDLGGKILAIVV
jgi:hypothetical protein